MNNSHEWIRVIMNRLFEPEQRRVDRMVEQLTERNSAIKRVHTMGFMHLGVIYVAKQHEQMYKMTATNLKGSVTPPLAFELLSDVSKFIADLNKLELDKAQIKQVLFKLVSNTNTKQELRDSLPECIIAFMPELKDLNRQMEDCTTFIRSDWRGVRDYERMLPKIEMYAVSRLIY